jgi:hypothetical protein
MERGDYTGAVRRTVTAIEAVLRSALVHELEKRFSPAEAEERASRTDNDFPGRLAQWRRLAQPPISQTEFDEFESTRKIRHQIVHRGLRLTHQDRGRAQRAVDTGRWLYNKIEGQPERARIRDFGVLKSVGRATLAVRFPSVLDRDGITLRPLGLQMSGPRDHAQMSRFLPWRANVCGADCDDRRHLESSMAPHDLAASPTRNLPSGAVRHPAIPHRRRRRPRRVGSSCLPERTPATQPLPATAHSIG